MSDTATIAAISAGATLLASTIGGALAYLSARRSTEVQLEAIEAEMERLRASHEEEDRQHRKMVYITYLDVLNRQAMAYGGWGELEMQTYTDLAEEYSLAHTNLLLFGSERVIAENGQISAGLDAAARDLTDTEGDGRPFAERVRATYRPYRDQIAGAQGRMIAAMKQELLGSQFVDELVAESSADSS